MSKALESVVLKGLTPEELSGQLSKNLCPSCRQSIVNMLDTSNSHIVGWLIDTPCGHSRLCKKPITCPVCANPYWVCSHCGVPLCPECHGNGPRNVAVTVQRAFVADDPA